MHLAEVSQREELGMGEEFQLKLQCRCFAAADLDASSGRVIAGQIAEGRIGWRETSRFPTSFERDSARGHLCCRSTAFTRRSKRESEIFSPWFRWLALAWI